MHIDCFSNGDGSLLHVKNIYATQALKNTLSGCKGDKAKF